MNLRLDVVIVFFCFFFAEKDIMNQPAKCERGLWAAILGQATPASDYHTGVKRRNVLVFRKIFPYEG